MQRADEQHVAQSGREWYLVQAKARRERLAVTHLERQGYATWLPLLRVPVRGGHRIEALFPGYLFVHLDPGVDNFAPIRSTIGVLRLVRFGAVYARIPDAMVRELSAAADAHGVCDAPVPALRPGERIEIAHGLLTGYQGVVERVRGRERIAVLLEIAGRHVGVVTLAHDVKPV